MCDPIRIELDADGHLHSTNMRMIVCAICGNKRCPHATDHRLACTNSNDRGQDGSSYGPTRAVFVSATIAAPAAKDSPSGAIYEQRLLGVLAALQRYLPPDGVSAHDTLSAIIGLVDPWPAPSDAAPTAIHPPQPQEPK